jgi:hypothetical protein
VANAITNFIIIIIFANALPQIFFPLLCAWQRSHKNFKMDMDFSWLLDGVYIICLGLNLSSLYRQTKSSDTCISKISKERSVCEMKTVRQNLQRKFFVWEWILNCCSSPFGPLIFIHTWIKSLVGNTASYVFLKFLNFYFI